MIYKNSLLEQIFLLKTNNNLQVNLTFPSNARTLWLLIFILSKQMLQIKVFSNSPLTANSYISSTCCTIMCNIKPMQQESCSFFFFFINVKFKKRVKKRENKDM